MEIEQNEQNNILDRLYSMLAQLKSLDKLAVDQKTGQQTITKLDTPVFRLMTKISQAIAQIEKPIDEVTEKIDLNQIYTEFLELTTPNKTN